MNYWANNIKADVLLPGGFQFQTMVQPLIQLIKDLCFKRISSSLFQLNGEWTTFLSHSYLTLRKPVDPLKDTVKPDRICIIVWSLYHNRVLLSCPLVAFSQMTPNYTWSHTGLVEKPVYLFSEIPASNSLEGSIYFFDMKKFKLNIEKLQNVVLPLQKALMSIPYIQQ